MKLSIFKFLFNPHWGNLVGIWQVAKAEKGPVQKYICLCLNMNNFTLMGKAVIKRWIFTLEVGRWALQKLHLWSSQSLPFVLFNTVPTPSSYKEEEMSSTGDVKRWKESMQAILGRVKERVFSLPILQEFIHLFPHSFFRNLLSPYYALGYSGENGWMLVLSELVGVLWKLEQLGFCINKPKYKFDSFGKKVLMKVY